jgi:hypothetical protein
MYFQHLIDDSKSFQRMSDVFNVFLCAGEGVNLLD